LVGLPRNLFLHLLVCYLRIKCSIKVAKEWPNCSTS